MRKVLALVLAGVVAVILFPAGAVEADLHNLNHLLRGDYLPGVTWTIRTTCANTAKSSEPAWRLQPEFHTLWPASAISVRALVQCPWGADLQR